MKGRGEPAGVRPLVLPASVVVGPPTCDVVLGLVLLREGLPGASEMIRVYTPAPTAAFSRRDSRQPEFPTALRAAQEAGFAPVLRGPGGRLAAYHRGSVVIDHIVRAAHAQDGLVERFELFAALHATVLSELGLDARVGELEGEYCPGQYSVNGAGVAKLVGSAQRLTRDGWLFSSVIQVQGTDALRDVLIPTHHALNYDLAASTIGTVEDFVPGLTTEIVADALLRAYTKGGFDSLDVLPPKILRQVYQGAASLETQLALRRQGQEQPSERLRHP